MTIISKMICNRPIAFVTAIVIIAIVFVGVTYSIQQWTMINDRMKVIETADSVKTVANQVKALDVKTVQLEANTSQANQSREQLSSNIAELQTEVIRLRNQLEPRNISMAFLPGQSYSVNETANPYQESTEGTIAGLHSSSSRQGNQTN